MKAMFNKTLRHYRKGLLMVVFFSMFINVLMLTAPIYMLQVFDRVISSQNVDTLLFLTLIAAVAYFALSSLEAVRNVAMAKIGRFLEKNIGSSLFQLNLTEGRAPALVQDLRDLQTLKGFLSSSSVFPLMDAPWSPIFLLVLFLLHPLLGAVTLVGAGILVFLVILSELVTRKDTKEANVSAASALYQASTVSQNFETIKAMRMVGSLLNLWTKESDKASDLQARAAMSNGYVMALSRFVRLSIQTGILGFGAWLVIGNEITPGAMIAASILAARALAPIDQAIGSWRSFVAGRAAYKRIKDVFTDASEDKEEMKLPAPKGQLLVEKMTFAYPGATESLLKNINFQLDAGEIMGIVGPSAMGKTTLSHLLLGILSPTEGKIRLDGINLANQMSEELGACIGYLSQDVELFQGSVKQNIARMGEVDDEKVIRAAREAGIHREILDLPDGYDTVIGGSFKLSGGQKQRLGLARALYGNPSLIVLDEPNSNLDQDGEFNLIKIIANLKENGTTVIIVAHRTNILKVVDKLLILNRNKTYKFGKRDEILKQMQLTKVRTSNA